MSFRAYAERHRSEAGPRISGESLVASAGNQLYAFLEDGPKKIAENETNRISDVCVHGDNLVYTDGGRIRQAGGEVLDELDGYVSNLCSYRGALFYSKEEIGSISSKLCRLGFGAVAEVDDRMAGGLCVHGGDLYYATQFEVFKSGERGPVGRTRYAVPNLFSQEDGLFYTDGSRIRKVGIKSAFSEQKSQVFSACAIFGTLYLGYEGEVREVTPIDALIAESEGKVSSICINDSYIYYADGRDVRSVGLGKGPKWDSVLKTRGKVKKLLSVPTYVLQRAGVI